MDGGAKRRIVVLIVAVVALGFLGVTLANYAVSRAWVRETIVKSDLPLTSDTLYSEIQQDLLKPIFVSSLMAHDTFVRDWVLDGERDPGRMTRYLAEIQKKYDAFTAFFVSDRTGVYYQSKGVLKTVHPDEPRDVWFYRVRDMSRPYETNVDPDMANLDTITIFINFRVFDYRGNFIGATGVGLQASTVKQLVERYEREYHRTVTFVDRKGMLQLYGRDFDASEPDIRKRPGIRDVADALLAAPQGSFEYRRDGQTFFVTSRFIPDLDWYLLVEQNGTAALASAQRTLVTSLAFGAAATLVVTWLCALLVRRSHRRLESLAAIDPLTGLLSRLAFAVVFAQASERALREPRPTSLAFFDIDHFKAINDTHGHAVGDQVLVAVAERLHQAVRGSDALCRWGGEEFLLLLEDCDLGAAEAVADKARDAVAATPLVLPGGVTIALTVSAGVAERDLGEDADALIARADAALYRAKDSGRNRTERAADQASSRRASITQ
ncbi:Diguanylate cyclase [uncultured Alphaproteobacteria bacterium]|uniref:diguanylate cyclase n=1 Tax=uncultured Alphaproteobacteria bacterium TaxID=91750 RepID=A0A212JY28_9PROT|nr:Diguanylate cyclase [uncultured Alphaproteobacteria bacterium]